MFAIRPAPKSPIHPVFAHHGPLAAAPHIGQLLNHLAGSTHFHGQRLDSNVNDLAHSILTSGDYHQLPVLRDALMDSGVDIDRHVDLTHLPQHIDADLREHQQMLQTAGGSGRELSRLFRTVHGMRDPTGVTTGVLGTGGSLEDAAAHAERVRSQDPIDLLYTASSLTNLPDDRFNGLHRMLRGFSPAARRRLAFPAYERVDMSRPESLRREFPGIAQPRTLEEAADTVGRLYPSLEEHTGGRRMQRFRRVRRFARHAKK